MIAGKESRHSNTLFRDGKARILPTAAIYGANAAGKSALLGAENIPVRTVAPKDT